MSAMRPLAGAFRAKAAAAKKKAAAARKKDAWDAIVKKAVGKARKVRKFPNKTLDTIEAERKRLWKEWKREESARNSG